MKNNKNNIIPWGHIIIALVFICNPNVGIVDILPDFIGYILLATSIAKVAAIDEKISDAHDLWVRLIYITLVRFASVFFAFGFVPPTDQGLMILVLSFVFDTLELMAIVPATVKLFDGILYLSERHGGKAGFLPAGRAGKKNITPEQSNLYGKSITDRTRRTVLTFLFAKAILGTLPEFASLSGNGWDESIWGTMYRYIGIFRIMGIIICLVFSLFFIVITVKYVLAMRKDTEFYDSLRKQYDNEILSRTDYLSRRSVMTAFGYFGISSVLALDFSLDGYNIIPDALSALCIIGGLLAIRKYITNWKKPLVPTVIYFFVSLAETVVQYIFASRYFVEAVDVDPETFRFYAVVCIVSALASVARIVSLVFVVRFTLAEIIEKHTGFSMTSNDTYNPDEKIKQLHRQLKKRVNVLILFAVLSAVASVVSNVLVTAVGGLWIVVIAIDVVSAVMTFKILNEIKEQIDYKYMLS